MVTPKLFLFMFVALILIVEIRAPEGQSSSKSGLFFRGTRQKIVKRLHWLKAKLVHREANSNIKNTRLSNRRDSSMFMGSNGEVPDYEDSSNKVTIVGAGRVGTAVAFSLITQYVTDEIVLLDRYENLVKGEVEDLQHGTGFIKSPRILGGTDYKLSKNSKICIVTAGAKQEPGQSRLGLVQKNLEIFRNIIPPLVENSPDAIILIVSNPVDIMTYIAWKIINKPGATSRIIGSGTNLDSSRLRFLISQDLNISPESVHGWVIGEHGDSSVTAWSGVNVAGVNIRSIPQLDESMAKKIKTDQDGGDWYLKVHKQMQQSAYDIINLKGYTSWAVGLSVANLAYSILHNVHNIHAVSTMVKGQHGIKDEVFLSLPCVLGDSGVTHIITQPLEEEELKKLKTSANTMLGIIKGLKWN